MSKGRIESIKKPMMKENVKLIRGDIRRYTTVEHAVKDAEYVFHAAAIIESCSQPKNDLLVHDTNVTGTLNLLVASARLHVNRFIYLSSAAVYGEQDSLPISEEARTNPISLYGTSKLAAEQYCRLFNSVYDLPTIRLRLFNVYGPRQSQYAGVVTNFVDRLLRNRRPTIFGDGSQTRDFVHVSDVTNAIIKAASSEPNVNGKVFNIGSGKPMTIDDLERRIADICGKRNSHPKHAKPREGDILHSYADICKAETCLGFRCNVSLEDGLADYVASRRRGHKI